MKNENDVISSIKNEVNLSIAHESNNFKVDWNSVRGVDPLAMKALKSLYRMYRMEFSTMGRLMTGATPSGLEMMLHAVIMVFSALGVVSTIVGYGSFLSMDGVALFSIQGLFISLFLLMPSIPAGLLMLYRWVYFKNYSSYLKCLQQLCADDNHLLSSIEKVMSSSESSFDLFLRSETSPTFIAEHGMNARHIYRHQLDTFNINEFKFTVTKEVKLSGYHRNKIIGRIAIVMQLIAMQNEVDVRLSLRPNGVVQIGI